MTRRRLLLALAAVAASCSALFAWLARRGMGDREPHSSASEGALPEPAQQPEGEFVFAPDTLATLFVIADAIVPRFGDSPAASEIDLVPRLERLIRGSPAALKTYRERWPLLAKDIQEKVPLVDGRPDQTELARRLRIYHRRFRRTPLGGKFGNAFEQLRRDVLRVYYASPQGQAFVGYLGPHHGPMPKPETRA